MTREQQKFLSVWKKATAAYVKNMLYYETEFDSIVLDFEERTKVFR